MRYRVDFANGDNVYYVTSSGKFPAKIVSVNEDSNDERYQIEFVRNRNVYRKGERITTSGNWLKPRATPHTQALTPQQIAARKKQHELTRITKIQEKLFKYERRTV